MIVDFITLFLSVFITGLVLLSKKITAKVDLKGLLIFGGAYLFSLTIIHLLPEVYLQSTHDFNLGFFVLLGFFLQLGLEHFSQGVEHGHIHHQNHHKSSIFSRPVFLLISLAIHAFLEGTLLAHPTITTAHDHEGKALLVGIILHKIPAAVALVSILIASQISRRKLLAYIIIFALASPVGLLLSDFLVSINALSTKAFLILFALVSGNFLHISTTIFFENNPEHKLNAKKLLISMLGAFFAILAEWIM